MTNYPKDVLDAYNLAKETRERAYAPYSKFKVGCCFKAKSGKLYPGHNIENVAFPSCTCAETVALGSAIVNEGRGSLEFLVVVADAKDPVGPCGNCRQIIAEHTSQDFPIYLADTKQIREKVTISQLLSHHFNSLT